MDFIAEYASITRGHSGDAIVVYIICVLNVYKCDLSTYV